MTEEDNTGCQVNNKDPGASELSTSGVESRNLVTPLEQESMFDMDEQDDESDALDTSDPRDSAASPEDLNDEEFGENESVSKKCTYSGCTETTTQVAKARKPWMCKKHRNKMYKDKYKKKKNDQAMTSGKLDVSIIIPLRSCVPDIAIHENAPGNCYRFNTVVSAVVFSKSLFVTMVFSPIRTVFVPVRLNVQ